VMHGTITVQLDSVAAANPAFPILVASGRVNSGEGNCCDAPHCSPSAGCPSLHAPPLLSAVNCKASLAARQRCRQPGHGLQALFAVHPRCLGTQAATCCSTLPTAPPPQTGPPAPAAALRGSRRASTP
jgi:hypothetical protein